jgi:ribonuclease P protein component
LSESRAARERLTLPAERRLRRKAEFDAVYTHGRRLGNAHFSVVVYESGAGAPRLGLAVSKKAAGSSVERNRLRRLVRESFRLHQHSLPPVDLVVSARPTARGVDNRELHASLAALWKRVRQQCASSPSS